MPSIKEVSFADGIKIVGSGVTDGSRTAEVLLAAFPDYSGQPDAEAKLEAALTALLQPTYESELLVSDIHPDDPVRQDPAVLAPFERIEKKQGKDRLITTSVFVAVHVIDIGPPAKCTVRCGNPEDGPVTGDWWL